MTRKDYIVLAESFAELIESELAGREALHKFAKDIERSYSNFQIQRFLDYVEHRLEDWKVETI